MPDDEPLGLYLSFPFCRSKCSYCNFASGVFPRRLLDGYGHCLRREMELIAAEEGSRAAASLYWGGGTPSLLPPEMAIELCQLQSQYWPPADGAEFTMEAAPATITLEGVDAWRRAGVNRVSLGVQSWQLEEIRAVGRLHRPEDVENDMARLRQAGIENLNLDLIAGLPHQTEASWRDSLARTMAAAPPHVSVYMLEVDEDSRLGRELIAGGTRYHAHAAPDDERTADFYEFAIEQLAAGGWQQYEISNFARPGFESRHNLRYWTRGAYLGFGLEAHSMLRAGRRERRWGNPTELGSYMGALEAGRLARHEIEELNPRQQLEEALFLGLRRNAGVIWSELESEFGREMTAEKRPAIAAAVGAGMMEEREGRVLLTSRGRMLATSVLAELLD